MWINESCVALVLALWWVPQASEEVTAGLSLASGCSRRAEKQDASPVEVGWRNPAQLIPWPLPLHLYSIREPCVEPLAKTVTTNSGQWRQRSWARKTLPAPLIWPAQSKTADNRVSLQRKHHEWIKDPLKNSPWMKARWPLGTLGQGDKMSAFYHRPCSHVKTNNCDESVLVA